MVVDTFASVPLVCTGLTRLTEAPSVENVTCEEFYVRWRAWTVELDTGHPPVGSYTYVPSYFMVFYFDQEDLGAIRKPIICKVIANQKISPHIRC